MTMPTGRTEAEEAQAIAFAIAGSDSPAEQNQALKARIEGGLSMAQEWAEIARDKAVAIGVSKMVADVRRANSRAQVHHDGRTVTVVLNCMVTEIGPDGRPHRVRRHVGRMTRAQRAEVASRTRKSQAARDPLLTVLALCDQMQDLAPGSVDTYDAAEQLQLDFGQYLANPRHGGAAA